MKYPIQGAIDQLSTEVNALGEVEHYLWGFEGWYDSWVRITEETHERIRSFLLEGTENDLHDLEGFMVSDGDGIPVGSRVKVWIHLDDRNDDESPWFFDIERADDAQVPCPPKVMDPARVGTYSPLAGAGGGLVFDDVLEYRVWFKRNGESVYRAFATFEEAEAFSKRDLPRIEPPLALVLQREYVEEPEPGQRFLVRQQRVAEWSVGWLDDAHLRTPENLRRILGDMEAPRVAG